MAWLTVTDYLSHRWPPIWVTDDHVIWVTDDHVIWVTDDHVICSVCRKYNPVLSSFMTYHWICSKNNKTGFTCGAETGYLLRVHEFRNFLWSSCCSIFKVFLHGILYIIVFFSVCPPIYDLWLPTSDYWSYRYKYNS